MLVSAQRPGEIAFVRPTTVANSPWLGLLLSVVLFATMAAGLLLAIVGNAGPLSLHAMTTLPALGAIGMLAAAISVARSPRRVVLDDQGITLEGRRGRSIFLWSDVGDATIGQTPLSARWVLTLCDRAGAKLASIDQGIEGFERLRELVVAKVAARPDGVAENIRSDRSKRAARRTLVFGVIMSAVSASIAWMGHRDERAVRMLAHSGVAGEAEIVRRFMAPNGVTPRLEYKVTSNGRSATRNAEVERTFWNELEGEKTVPVIYVPEEPELSRLAAGEPRKEDFFETPLGNMLSGLGAIMSLFCFAAAAMFWRGWDIGTDPQTGKFTWKRYGAP